MLSLVLSQVSFFQLCIAPSPRKLKERTEMNSLKSNYKWGNSLLVAETWPRRESSHALELMGLRVAKRLKKLIKFQSLWQIGLVAGGDSFKKYPKQANFTKKINSFLAWVVSRPKGTKGMVNPGRQTTYIQLTSK